jgi:hypothetical protein
MTEEEIKATFNEMRATPMKEISSMKKKTFRYGL